MSCIRHAIVIRHARAHTDERMSQNARALVTRTNNFCSMSRTRASQYAMHARTQIYEYHNTREHSNERVFNAPRIRRARKNTRSDERIFITYAARQHISFVAMCPIRARRSGDAGMPAEPVSSNAWPPLPIPIPGGFASPRSQYS